MKPTIAIVGRPNVGKSHLFNKLAGRRVSIVEDVPGVTRDRVTADCEWSGRELTLIDTGGIDRSEEVFSNSVREQARLAMDICDVAVLVCDVRAGVTEEDEFIAAILRKSGKPVVLAVNKNDSVGATHPDNYEFYGLGLGDPIPVSALHGHGCGDLLDACIRYFPSETIEKPDGEIISVAIVGKPNVGKSSLLNKLIGDDRAIVSDIAGTTRDATDSYFENDSGKFMFIDTAGMRKKARVTDKIEHFSVLRAAAAIERADICMIMLDARDGVTEQDTKVAGMALAAGKGLIVVVNKWDLTEKDTHTMDNFAKKVRADLPFMSWAPIAFVSALTGSRVQKLFDLIVFTANQNAQRVTTGQLNSLLADATARVQPPTDKGKRLKLLYITQASVKPPTFVVFCNDIELFHFSYKRYIENQLRQVYGFEGAPVIIEARHRSGD